ncbi:MAG: Ig-like domain-containing protein [Gemmatimonadaceae bacterium]
MRPWRNIARLGVAIAGVALACTEGPTGVPRFGQLRVVPTFADGEDPAQLQVTVDSIAVVVSRTREASAVVVDTIMPYAAGNPLSWLVEMLAGEDSLAVELTLSGGSAALYAGAQRVLVPEATGESGTAYAIDVHYVGPPITVSVVVTPATAVVRSLSDRLTLHAEAYRSSGARITDATFFWSSSDPGIAAVDPATGVVTPVADGNVTILAAFGGATGSALVTVAQSVTTISISPGSASHAALGLTTAFLAQARDTQGRVMSGVEFHWSSSSPAVATITDDGIATSVGVGEARLTATAAGSSATATLSVRQDPASVDVSPASHALVAIGSAATFTAIVRDANGHVIPGVDVLWSSSNPAVATVGATTGTVTSVGVGTATIMATAGGIAGQGTIHVSQSASRVDVTPTATTFGAIGAQASFSARLTDANGTTIPGAVFAWTSQDATVVSIDRITGVATAVGTGSTKVIATSAGLTGTATASVVLDAPGHGVVIVTPSGATLVTLGAAQQFSAAAFDDDRHPVPQAAFTWTSSSPSVASVTPLGVATAVAAGTTTISASFNGSVGRATLSVSPAIVSVTIIPTSAVLAAIGAQRGFTAEARDAGGNVVPGAPIVWSSSDPAIVTIGASNGVATATGSGSATVIARSGNASDRATVVVQQQVASVSITPVSPVLASIGISQQFVAVAKDANGYVVPLLMYTWSSTHPSVATVDASGLATSVATGSTTISAVASGVTGTATLTVSQQPVSIDVNPPTLTFDALGGTQSLSAVVRDANGQVIPGASVSWTSLDVAVATVDATGIVTAVANGTTTITVASGGATQTAAVTVSQVPASVVVTPASVSLLLGATQQFSAVAYDANGQVVVGATFAWRSSRRNVASVDANGLAVATEPGTTTITARARNATGGATLTVH